MGKKSAAKKKGELSAEPVTGGAKYVRVETTAIIALLALVIGFFGGEILKLSKPSGPVSGQPVMPSGDMPAPKGPSVEQASKILALEKEVSANPRNVEAWTELGHHYFDSHQHEKAIEAYKKSLDLRPDNANVWTDMGVMYRDIGKPSEALAAFDKAMQIDPRHEVSRFNKGVLLMMDMGDHKGAVEAWEELLKINPSAKGPGGEPIKELLEKMRGSNQGE
jgi:cytochrome c-type biogenesis protein CcmH/NrfG